MRFLRLELKDWRNFTSVDVELRDRVFLVGPNAAGKSNLLDVFRFLRDIADPQTGFQRAVTQRGGVTKIRSLYSRRNSDVILRCEIGADERDKLRWRYELEFNKDRKGQPVVKAERVFHAGKLILKRPDPNDLADAQQLTQTHLEQVNANRKFRELAEFFASVQYLHIVPQLVREPDRSVGRVADPFGGDFLEQIARETKRRRDARLKLISKALQVAVPNLKQLELRKDEVRGVPHLHGLYEHWRPNAGWQAEDQFSDGTLRLLGLLWGLQNKGGPLLLEEPELSLHASVVAHIAGMIAAVQGKTSRQVILSTHSVNLLTDEGIGLDEILSLTPRGELGTGVTRAIDDAQIKALVEGGASPGEVVVPRTAPRAPERLRQLSLLFDR